MKKFKALIVALALILSVVAPAANANAAAKSKDVCVLYTTDVHCGGTTADAWGYASLAAYKKDMKKQYKNVTLVDSGDAIQGEPIGVMSSGQWIVDIMNAVGYDIATLGNHEFDYTVPVLDKLIKSAKYKYVSCNYTKLNKKNKTVVDPYTIVDCGTLKVAYVGITTPETFSKSTPAYFKNKKGEFIYSFAEGNNGKELYKTVQKNVDAARKAGANFVIAVAHLGNDDASKPWTSKQVIKKTTGIDVLLDGHSHVVVGKEKNTYIKNKNGKKVFVAQSGTKLEVFGKLIISQKGKIKENTLISAEDYTKLDNKVNKLLKSINSEYEAVLAEKAGTSDFTLYINNPVLKDDGTSERWIRSRETNAGNFVADAYLWKTGADIAVVNGGGIRVDIPAGEITIGTLMTLHPFGNELMVKETTGQHILDLLEMSASKMDEHGVGENGGFQHPAGMTFTIDATIPSPVVINDKGEFVKVDGTRRVKDVMVLNKETGKYEPIDAKKTYTIASHNYLLQDGGDGLVMFQNDKVLVNSGVKDYQVVLEYLQDACKGKVPEEYKNPEGQGRITIKTAD